jgi:hypothetical protein
MADRKKTILAILGAAFLIVIIFAVLGIAGFAYFIRTHVSTADVSDQTAAHEMAAARERFAGQTPMIGRRPGADDEDRFEIHVPEGRASAAPVDALRILAFNPRDGRLLRVSVPFWVLRFTRHGAFNILDSADMDVGRARLSVDDLERHGPGLILDTRDARGSQILVWLE